MKGLLLKDLINLKKQAFIYLVFILFYGVVSVSSNNVSFIGGMICVVSAMMPITALSFDERANWDKYALTMPVSRRDMVLEKYILGLLCATGGLAVLLLFQWIIPVKEEGDLISIFILYAVSILYLSLLLPVLFKLGVEKGRILMMLFFAIPFAAVFIVSKLDLQMPDIQTLKSLLYGFPAFVAAVYILSFFLSFLIYRKKEL